jgi:hypothetical protein
MGGLANLILAFSKKKKKIKFFIFFFKFFNFLVFNFYFLFSIRQPHVSVLAKCFNTDMWNFVKYLDKR